MSDHADQDPTAAVASLLARMQDAWGRGDAVAYAECFTEDADYVTFNGMHLRGRAENARVHDALFRGVLKGTGLSAEMEDLTFLSQNVALVHTTGKRKPSIQTFVLIQQDGHWLIRSFHNTRVQRFSAWLTRYMVKRASAR